MDAAAATEIIERLEVLHPRMTSDGYKASRQLRLTFVERGALGKGIHGRYAPNQGAITFCGIEQVEEAHALDTITHEYAHAVLDMAFHQCPRFRRTAGHCSHFAAKHKEIVRLLTRS